MTTPAPTPRHTFIKFLIPALVIVVLASGALYFVKSRLAPQGGQSQSASAGPVQIGSVIPDFKLTGTQGNSTLLSKVNAKVILINFWATWCEACTYEMPSLVKLQKAYQGKGFQVVGINLDENPEAVLPKAEKELGINFPVYGDADGKITDYFDVHAIPLSVVLGPGRKILYIENGERNWNDQEIHQQLDHWLRES